MNKENVVYINNRILFIHKNNDFLSFSAKWMVLEDIMLNEILQTQKEKYCVFSYVKAKKCGPKCRIVITRG
jgi:hypothetical protein